MGAKKHHRNRKLKPETTTKIATVYKMDQARDTDVEPEQPEPEQPESVQPEQPEPETHNNELLGGQCSSCAKKGKIHYPNAIPHWEIRLEARKMEANMVAQKMKGASRFKKSEDVRQTMSDVKEKILKLIDKVEAMTTPVKVTELFADLIDEYKAKIADKNITETEYAIGQEITAILSRFITERMENLNSKKNALQCLHETAKAKVSEGQTSLSESD